MEPPIFWVPPKNFGSTKRCFGLEIEFCVLKKLEPPHRKTSSYTTALGAYNNMCVYSSIGGGTRGKVANPKHSNTSSLGYNQARSQTFRKGGVELACWWGVCMYKNPLSCEEAQRVRRDCPGLRNRNGRQLCYWPWTLHGDWTWRLVLCTWFRHAC